MVLGDLLLDVLLGTRCVYHYVTLRMYLKRMPSISPLTDVASLSSNPSPEQQWPKPASCTRPAVH